jgi:hypothetical protein
MTDDSYMNEYIVKLHTTKTAFEMMGAWYMAEVIGHLIEMERSK